MVSCIFYQVLIKYLFSLFRETFFSNYGEWGIQNIFLFILISKCKFDLSKRSTHKSFANKADILVPHLTYSKKKSFHLIEESLRTFYEQNVENASNHLIFRKQIFYKQGLDDHRPFKILCHTSGRQKSWSLLVSIVCLYMYFITEIGSTMLSQCTYVRRIVQCALTGKRLF